MVEEAIEQIEGLLREEGVGELVSWVGLLVRVVVVAELCIVVIGDDLRGD